ncbi:MAG TPA: MFS transporter [Pseudonocardiaceae bacterium]
MSTDGSLAKTSRPRASLVSDNDGVPSELAPHRPGEAGYRSLILALFAAGVATFAALYSTQPLIGILAARFAVPQSHAAWSVSAATLLLGLGMVVAGPLSDRWGRTRTIKVSLCATAILGALCAVAPTWPVLLVARALQGLALAGTPAVALVYLREEVHTTVAPRATGLYIGGTALGGMVGRLLAGGVSDLAGWRWAVGAIAILGGVCAVLVMLCLPASRHPLRLRCRAEVLGLAKMWMVLGNRRLLGLYVIAGALMGAFVAAYNVLGLRLNAHPYDLSVFVASLVFCVYPLGAVGSTVAGRVAEHRGRAVVILVGSLITLAGVAITLLAPLPFVVVGTAVLTIGFFSAHGVASGWAAAVGHHTHRAASQASAFYLLSYYIGSSVFGALGTNLWTVGGWPAVAAMAAALILVAVGVSASSAARSHRHSLP